MKRIIVVLFALLIFTTSCKKEEPAPIAIDALLIGKWNGYEAGGETGFSPNFYSLTLMYEHGITFSTDDTFTPRYRMEESEVDGPWEERGVAGQYTIINNEKIRLRYNNSSSELEVQIIKLDDKEFWFRHSYFGREMEYHLKRVE